MACIYAELMTDFELWHIT